MIDAVIFFSLSVLMFSLIGLAFMHFTEDRTDYTELNRFITQMWISYQKEYDRGDYKGQQFKTKAEYIEANLDFLIKRAKEENII